jgi:hypothetical protein
MPKVTPFTLAIGAGLTILSHASEIYDFFAGPPGGDLDVMPEDYAIARQQGFIKKFLQGGEDRAARIAAANRIRRQRLQRPTPYAPQRYSLDTDSGQTGTPGRPGSSPSTSSSTVPPPANLPASASSNINDLIIQIESSGSSSATPPNSASGAYGLAQVIPSTFNRLVERAKFGDPLYGKSFNDYKASPALQRAALEKLTESNVRDLKNNKMAIDDVSIYLAHFIGVGDAIKVLRAPDNTPINKVVSEKGIAANPWVFSGVKTVGDLKAWAKKKITRAQMEIETSSGPAPRWLGAATASVLASMQSDNVKAKDGVLPPVSVTGKKGMKPELKIPNPPVLTNNRAINAFRQRAVQVESSKSGTAVTGPNAPLPVVDEEANKRLEKIEKSQVKVEKETKGLSVSSKLASRNFLRKELPTRRIPSPKEQADEFLKNTQQGFLNEFDKTLTNAFKNFGTNFLKSVGYAPGGTPVTAQETMRVGYAGTQLGGMLDLDKKVAKGLEKIIGKEYGRMLAPAVSQLGKAYLNNMVVGIGQSLFTGVRGPDGTPRTPEIANAITGQILGNLAKGNKQIAMEQLLYGLTGIATGPETIAQSYGFRSAAEGIGYMAEVFAARATDAVRGLFGFEDRTAPQQVRDPVTGKVFTPDETQADQSMRNIFAGGYGGMYRREAAKTLATSQMTTMVGKSNNLLTEGAATLNGVLLVSVVNAGEFASDNDKFKQELLRGLTSFGQRGLGEILGGPSVSGPFGPILRPGTVPEPVGPRFGDIIRQAGPGIQGTIPIETSGGGMFGLGGGMVGSAAQRQGTIDYSLVPSNRYGMVGTAVANDISQTSQYSKLNYDLYNQGIKLNANAIGDSTTQNVSVTNAADKNNQVGMEVQTEHIVGAVNDLKGTIGSSGSGAGSTMPMPGGSFGDSLMGFAKNMAVSFVANKLTSKIKNPYLRAFANFGIQTGIQRILTPTILSTGGAAAGAGAATGAAGGGAVAGGAAGGLAAGGFLGSLAALPGAFSAAGGFAGLGTAIGRSFGLFGGSTAGATFSQYAASILGSSGFATGANFFSGMTANSFSQAGSLFGTAGQFGYGISKIAPYAGAIINLFQGNVKGAALSAAGTYIGTAIGGPIGGLIGSTIGSLLGKKSKKEETKIVDKVIVLHRKDIAKKETILEKNKPTDGQKALVDALLNVAFNTAMSIYQVSKANPPFVAIYISMRNDKIKMALPRDYSGGVIKEGWAYEAKLDKKKTAAFYMLEIMRKIKEVYKAESQDPAYLKSIDDGYKLVANKSQAQLAGGIISDLQYGKHALTQPAAATTQTRGAYFSDDHGGFDILPESSTAVEGPLTVATTRPETLRGAYFSDDHGGFDILPESSTAVYPKSGTITSVNVTPLTGAGSDDISGTRQNVSVVADNSTKNIEGSTINTTYLNTSTSSDVYGRGGVNTEMPIRV